MAPRRPARQDRRMRVYLAGPEVFLPDALAIAAAKKRLCAAHGLEGVFPLDPAAAGAAGGPGLLDADLSGQ
jgi:nucleoside 2-deoxyribosyltransferase